MTDDAAIQGTHLGQGATMTAPEVIAKCSTCKQELEDNHNCKQAIWERRLAIYNQTERELRELAEIEFRLEKRG